jgi:hypothetical protein
MVNTMQWIGQSCLPSCCLKWADLSSYGCCSIYWWCYLFIVFCVAQQWFSCIGFHISELCLPSEEATLCLMYTDCCCSFLWLEVFGVLMSVSREMSIQGLFLCFWILYHSASHAFRVVSKTMPGLPTHVAPCIMLHYLIAPMLCV